MKQTAIAALCAALALNACSKNETPPPAASAASAVANNTSCEMPALNSQVKQILQDTIGNNAKRLANANDYIDADKLIALAAQLNVTTSNAQAGQMPETCQAQVAIAIPENLIKQAQTNAPLLQSEAPQDIISRHLTGGNGTFSNHTLSFPLNYAVKNNQFAPTDNNLTGAANLLADALAAYGVKDTLNVNGKNVSRAEALKLLKQKDQPKAEEASIPAPQAVPPIDNIPEPPKPEDLRKAVPAPKTDALDNSASAPAKPQPEKLTPPVEKQNNVSDKELNAAREANGKADQSIKSAWRKIDPQVQQDLVDEQREWESKKRANCRNAAAKGKSATESQYLQLQCDTRMTRERVQYLKGYSIE
jgi:hypothetical protein